MYVDAMGLNLWMMTPSQREERESKVPYLCHVWSAKNVLWKNSPNIDNMVVVPSPKPRGKTLITCFTSRTSVADYKDDRYRF